VISRDIGMTPNPHWVRSLWCLGPPKCTQRPTQVIAYCRPALRIDPPLLLPTVAPDGPEKHPAKVC
jgi:hypothetical protein